jgi:hypothetical protein
MQRPQFLRGSVVAAAVAAAVSTAWPGAAAAQTVVGQASGVRSTTVALFGPSTVALADTGALQGPADALEASLVTGSIPSVLQADVINAVTIGGTDQVDSEASLASVGLTVGGTGISADFVMARATGALGAAGSGSTLVDNLAINGVPVAVTGEPNQTISIPGGQLVINEQTVSAAGATVNALHATVLGAADVVVASATAGIQ